MNVRYLYFANCTGCPCSRSPCYSPLSVNVRYLYFANCTGCPFSRSPCYSPLSVNVRYLYFANCTGCPFSRSPCYSPLSVNVRYLYFANCTGCPFSSALHSSSLRLRTGCCPKTSRPSTCRSSCASTSQPDVFALTPSSSRNQAAEPLTVHLPRQRQPCGTHCRPVLPAKLHWTHLNQP